MTHTICGLEKDRACFIATNVHHYSDDAEDLTDMKARFKQFWLNTMLPAFAAEWRRASRRYRSTATHALQASCCAAGTQQQTQVASC